MHNSYSLNHSIKYLSAYFSILLLFNIIFSSIALAVPANPKPFVEKQPDGSTITLRIKGDEYFHWFEDLGGYTVVRNNGTFFYAQLDNNGQLTATRFQVGKTNPATANLRPGVLPPENVRAQSSLATPRLSPSFNTPQSIVPSGNIKNLVVMVRFSNHQSRILPSISDMNTLFNAADSHPTIAPTGSIRDLFLKNSYGQLTLNSDISGWIDVSRSEQYYADGGSGLNSNVILEALQEALDILDQTVDFSQYDSDNDGFIDAITFIHSGYGAESGGTDVDGTGKDDRIWSHKFAIQPAWESNEEVKVFDYHISPSLWGTQGSAIGRVGVIAHETGHFFGLPDLYDTDQSSNGIGSYGLMANPWGFDGTQYCPPHLSAWSKMRLGWTNPVDISEDGEYTLRQAESNADVYRISQGFPSGEYLLIENRQKSHIDCPIPQGGLAIWHIDETKDTNNQNQDNTEEGYPGQASWPENGNHYRVALLQADGLYQLENNGNRGDGGDVFHSDGVDSIGPGPSNHPNTDTYQSGIINQTDHSIHSISASGPTMTFCLGDTACGDNQNIAPLANDDTVSPIDSGSSVTIDVLSNDSDTDGTLVPGNVTIVDDPANGSASVDLLTGEITYAHDGSATTSDSFTYTVEDNEGAVSNVATVTITINEVVIPNVAPSAQDDTAGPIESTQSVTIDVLNNDSDSDGSLVLSSVTIDTAPANGIATVDQATGQITYTHNGSATTSDSFTYTVDDNEGAVSNVATVTISINEVVIPNLAPIAQDDDVDPIDINGTVLIDVLSNDSDSDGSLVPGSVAIVDNPVYGSVSVDLSTGEITYVHDGSATSSDSFTYMVEDNEGAESNLATVIVTIEQETGICGMSVALDGRNDWINTPNLSFANDFTIEAWIKLAPGINYQDALIGQEGRGPDINFHFGKARLYTGRSDVVVSNTEIQANTWIHLAITRSGSNLSLYLDGTLDATGVWNGTLPVKALGRGNRTAIGHFQGELDEVRFWDEARSDSQILQNYNQSLNVGDNQGLVAYWTFNESGQSVIDSSGLGHDGSLGSGTGAGNDDPSRLISTAPFNEDCGSNLAPIAENDVVGPIDSGSLVTINVLSNDSDSDGSLALGSVAIVDEPLNGSVSVDLSTGEIAYVHDGSATTSDSFTYTVDDNKGAQSNLATVSIAINDESGSNVAPVAQDDVAGPIDSGSLVTIDVLSNDSDSDGSLDVGSVTIIDDPLHGSVSVDLSTGEITYIHDGSATTSDSFTYTVYDNEGAESNLATVTATIKQEIGTCGMSVALDGGNDWINTPNMSFANDFTIEAWIKLAPGINYLDALIGQEGRGADINFHFGKARLYTGRSDVVVSNTEIQANTWTHLAITRSGSNLSLYLDGTLDAAGVWNGTLPVKALGRGNRTAIGHFQGEMDEVRFWDEARSDSQILQNYNQSLNVGDNQGLVAYWTFNESGQSVIDSSGLGQNGSLGAGTNVGNDDPSRLVSTAPFSEYCGSNVAPIAQDDIVGPIDSGSLVTIDVLSNDSDSDGSLVLGSVAIIDDPVNGSISVDLSTGEITYVHDGSATTSDSFTYTVYDNEGAESNLATVNITIKQETGICGMSVTLDGRNDWINTPNLSFADDFTIEAWIKLAPGINYLDALIGQEGRGPDINFHFGKARLYTGRSDVVVSNTEIQANTWTHLAITRSGSNLSMYLDGTLDATGVWNGTLPVKALGRGNRTAIGHFQGEMDEVRFWDEARSDSQILQNYNQSLNIGDNQGLVAYWTFNESGQSVIDSSGLGHDGSLGSGTGAGNDDPSRLISTAPFNEDCGSF